MFITYRTSNVDHVDHVTPEISGHLDTSAVVIENAGTRGLVNAYDWDADLDTSDLVFLELGSRVASLPAHDSAAVELYQSRAKTNAFTDRYGVEFFDGARVEQRMTDLNGIIHVTRAGTVHAVGSGTLWITLDDGRFICGSSHNWRVVA